MVEPVIKVAGLSKRYRREKQVTDPWLWALRDVSFTVNAGEVWGVIGRNGSGKSTLLKIMARITEPTTGQITLRGRVASLLEIGAGFHQELSGRENVFLYGVIMGMSRQSVRRSYDSIVAFAELDRFMHMPVKRYSTGMRMRLAFAVAAHLEPDIMLIDEVLAVGDAMFQQKCVNVIRDQAQRGTALILVSHNLTTLQHVCQRALLLEQGVVRTLGDPADVLRTYLQPLQENSGEAVWLDHATAPGTAIARLHRVRVWQGDSAIARVEVDISREVLIEVQYWSLVAGERLYSTLHLKDQLGTIVFATSNHASVSATLDAWSNQPHPVGLYRSVCRIPGNFLNEGIYHVSVGVGRNISDTQVLVDPALTIRVYDLGEMRREYLGEWAGVVRPRLAWYSERLGDL